MDNFLKTGFTSDSGKIALCGKADRRIFVSGTYISKYEKLEIISVAYPTSIEQVKRVIANCEMTWTNIYNDLNLINLYVGQRAIPLVYLIDKEGKIVYFNQEVDVDDHLIKLNQLLKSVIAL